MSDSSISLLEGAFRDRSVSPEAVRWTPEPPETLPTLRPEQIATIIRERARRRQVTASARRRIAANLATSHVRKDHDG